MSDSARESLTGKAEKNLTPDSQKSTLDQVKDQATGAYDSAAGTLQPEGDKSATQKVSDSTSSGSKDVEGESKSYLQSAQEGAGNIATSVSDTLSDLANTVSGSGNTK